MVHHKALRDNFDSMQMSRDWIRTLYAFSTDSVPLMIWPVFEGTLQNGRVVMASIEGTDPGISQTAENHNDIAGDRPNECLPGLDIANFLPAFF